MDADGLTVGYSKGDDHKGHRNRDDPTDKSHTVNLGTEGARNHAAQLVLIDALAQFFTRFEKR